MSGIKKGLKKAFKKVKKVAKSKIGKTILAGAAIWFTAGTASAYFAAPQAGLGAAMSASANSMYLTATTGSFVSGAEAAGMAAAEGTTQAAMLTAQTAEFGGAGVTEAGVGSMTELAKASADVATTAAGGAGGVATGMTSGELAATMIGGQAVSGAITAREMEKESEREDEYRRSRGLMGVGYEGEVARPGIVAGQRQPAQPPVTGATARPVVSRPSATPQTRAIKRNNLPQLRKQGLIANQRRAY